MKEIPLTQVYVALVDDEDDEWLSNWKWFAARNRSSAPAVAVRNENKRVVYMHRQIMNTPAEMVTDHINHNTLDNRRCNLRVCTNSENCTNQTKRLGTSSKYLGVTWREDRSKWEVNFRLKSKNKYLGCFPDEEDAAIAYDEAVTEYRDEYATTNFPRV